MTHPRQRPTCPEWWPLPTGVPIGIECADEVSRWVETTVPPVLGPVIRHFRKLNPTATVSVGISTPEEIVGLSWTGATPGYTVGSIIGVYADDDDDDDSFVIEGFELVLTLSGQLRLVRNNDFVQLIDDKPNAG